MKRLQIDVQNPSCYVAIWALGLLQAMKAGIIPFEAGIWTFARPKIIQELEPHCISELCDLLQTLDELDAMNQLCGTEKTLNYIDEISTQLHIILERYSEEYYFELMIKDKI